MKSLLLVIALPTCVVLNVLGAMSLSYLKVWVIDRCCFIRRLMNLVLCCRVLLVKPKEILLAKMN